MGGKSRIVYGRTWDEADSKRRALETELAAGLPGGADQTLEQWLGHWLGRVLPARVAAKRLAQSTLDSYRDNSRKHILPDLGPIPLRRLSVSRIQQWQHDLTLKPSRRQRVRLRKGETELPPAVTLSLRTVAYCQAILRAALNDAMRDELLTRNVAALVEPPDADDDERAALTKEEMIQLLAAVGDDHLRSYWVVVLTLGLRRGEALALRWQDVDLEAGTVRIGATLQRVREDGKTKLVRKRTKTKASKATVPAGRGVLDALREHQREQRRLRIAAPVWRDTDLVFATSIGTAIEPRNINREWEKICDRAGVQARVHDLRHACGTYLGAEGVPQKAIQAILRHKDMRTTEIYVHALEEVSRAAAETMDAVVTDLRRAAEERS
jgi:integrase